MTGTAPIRHCVSVRQPAIGDLFQLYADSGLDWQWPSPFVTLPWLSAWWQCFGRDYELLILQFEVDGLAIGIAPLMISERVACIIGSEDLCDHLDFPVQEGMEDIFFPALLDHLQERGIKQLVLQTIRPDSLIMRCLVPAAQALGCPVELRTNSVALAMPLPQTWEAYLTKLSAKQRHEVRRKFRRAEERGILGWRLIQGTDDLSKVMDVFFDLFRQSRSDKENFMTAEREQFFRLLAAELAAARMLRLFHLEMDDQPAAVVFSVEHKETMYLYNNGFNPIFRDLSIGTLSKLLSIRASIEAGKKVYDFLNGPEQYKYQLGGKEIGLMACTVDLL